MMPDPSTDIAGASALASIIGGGKGASAQQKDANAAGQLYSQEGNAIQQLLGNYMSQGMPIINDLANFGQYQQPEINALTTQLGQEGASTVKGIQSRLGGVANPNALIQSLYNSNAQNAQTGTVNMESNLVGQQLSGLQSGIQALTAPIGSALSGLQGLGNAYSGMASAQGNPLQNMFGQLANNPLLSALGGSSGGGSGPGGGVSANLSAGALSLPGIDGGLSDPLAGMNLGALGGYTPASMAGFGG